MSDLARGNLNNYGLTDYGASSNGFALPNELGGVEIDHVWILSTATVPQPTHIRGLWLDASVWIESSKWYL
jgi:hypothetical protein